MTIKDTLTLKLPLLQAPLTAYANQAAFVAAVSEQGALGVYSCDFQTVDEIKKNLRQIKQLTKQPFAVWVDLAESESDIDLADRSSTNAYLKTAYKALNIEESEAAAFPDINAVCKAVVVGKPPVIVFQNGLPTDEFIEHCIKNNIITLAVAANTLEVIAIHQTKLDGIILQGCESAGVQSQFENDLNPPRFPLSTLCHYAQQYTQKPLIVWGDCQTPADVNNMLNKGIKAIVLDTPFWTTQESPIPDSYREALREHNEMCVVNTSLWTGKPANTLRNALVDRSEQTALAPSKQKRIVHPIITAAIAQNNADYLPLWAGLCAVTSQCSLAELCQQFSQALFTQTE